MDEILMKISAAVIHYLDVIGIVTSIFVALFSVFKYNKSNKLRDEMRVSFDSTINGLFTENVSEKISSAILLRRFLNKHSVEGRNKNTYRQEAINVICSLLKQEGCSEYQKTLADSLSYSINLDRCDLQYSNLQNMYLQGNVDALRDDINIFGRLKLLFQENKTIRISMKKADLYMADVSYASFNDMDAQDIVFNKANLHRTKFKNCNLTNADFRNSYILGVEFINCILDGAKFDGCNGAYVTKTHVKNSADIEEKHNTYSNSTKVKVFISCLGTLTQEQSYFCERLKCILAENNVTYNQFTKHKYRDIGQLSAIKTEMAECSGVIVLGFKDTYINDGIFRPNTEEETVLIARALTSPWIHSEIGLAWGMNKPLLLMHDADVLDGIFDLNIRDNEIHQKSYSEINHAELSPIIRKWINTLRQVDNNDITKEDAKQLKTSQLVGFSESYYLLMKDN